MKKLYPWIPIVGIMLIFGTKVSPKELGWLNHRLGGVNMIGAAILQSLCILVLVFIILILRIH
jgi:hypothetical protein